MDIAKASLILIRSVLKEKKGISFVFCNILNEDDQTVIQLTFIGIKEKAE